MSNARSQVGDSSKPDLPNGFLIHSALEYHAQHTPNHPALSLSGNAMSYSELNCAANQLAHTLIEHQAEEHARVGIFLFKSFELAIGIYGALKAGCIFVPLDPFMPIERLAFILDDCDIKHIIVDDITADKLTSIHTAKPLHVYGTENDPQHSQYAWSTLESQSTDNPGLIMNDQSLAYIMYTSGSTGSPKGMMHSHLGSITYARWGAEHVDLTPIDRVASHAPLHFDLSIFDFFSTARVGATVVLVPESVVRFPASWVQTLESEKITVVFTVPYTLMTMYRDGAMDKRDLTSLRWVLFGGEPYPPAQLRELMNKLPHTQFTNVYGPAEAPSCTCHDITVADVQSDDPLPIGLLSRNSSGIVIDENGEDVPTGTAGELCIRSTTLTHGYWKQPELSKKAFLTRKDFGYFDTIYFRTGDRVVQHEDGLLRFLGRVDRMVKTRGHRVELDEVEAALSGHPKVAEAAAFVVVDELQSQLIMAAVTLKSQLTSDSKQLLPYIKEKLPVYALPVQIYVREELPHTSTGKIDRRVLSAAYSPTTTGDENPD
ncbi:MAG: amino acid adenylation domain-containing protein [Granulosicoccus sp.]|nr:amino acid adenylation domain-containing protein [Granulosicoccus sp.]